MIKLPEPIKHGPFGGIYTEAQLKQAVSDAYYEAAKVASSGIGLTTVSTVDRIRALIKEIDA